MRRFTPTVRTIAAFIPEDVGRPIDDLKLKVKVDDLPERVREVIRDLVRPGSGKSRDRKAGGFACRSGLTARPTIALDGAVLAFVDVDTLKRALKDAELARDYAKGIVGDGDDGPRRARRTR